MKEYPCRSSRSTYPQTPPLALTHICWLALYPLMMLLRLRRLSFAASYILRHTFTVALVHLSEIGAQVTKCGFLTTLSQMSETLALQLGCLQRIIQEQILSLCQLRQSILPPCLRYIQVSGYCVPQLGLLHSPAVTVAHRQGSPQGSDGKHENVTH